MPAVPVHPADQPVVDAAVERSRADLAKACASNPGISIVANPSLVTTRAQELVAELTRAGCRPGPVKGSMKNRPSSILYSNVEDPTARALAVALGLSIEPLTWDSPMPIVIALGDSNLPFP
jgi:hypothetical protein